MHKWQLQDAKARMSELVKQAQLAPQEITLHGKPVAVVVSRDDYARLSGSAESLVDFMRRSPLHGVDDIDFERDASTTREVAL